MTTYRKIYEDHYGFIPVDKNGRTYEIHHIDGDHENNNISNLIAVTIEEHYEIHKQLGDWGACLLISKRMDKCPEELAILAKKFNEERLENGTHNFLKPGFSAKVQEERVRNRTHPFLKREDGSSVGGDTNKKRISNGTYTPPMTTDQAKEIVKKQLENGTHSSQSKWTCEVCGKNGRGSGNYTMYHGTNCGSNRNNHKNNGRKRCTVDGVRIFESRKDLINELGWGTKGVGNPNFRYIL